MKKIYAQHVSIKRNKENILPEEAEAWKEAIKKIKGDIMINLD